MPVWTGSSRASAHRKLTAPPTLSPARVCVADAAPRTTSAAASALL